MKDLGASAPADPATRASHGAATASPPYGECPLRVDLLGGDVWLFARPFLGVDPSEALRELRSSIPWKAREISIAGRRVMQPRLTSWHADQGVSYTYSGRTHQPLPWTPTLLTLKAGVERLSAASFNSVLLNLYPNERASIGYHSDDEPELGERPVIASVSLGGEREFRFKPKGGGKSVCVPLTHGSVLIMRGATQENWMHGIMKSLRPCAERINLTFRLTKSGEASNG